VVADAGLLYDSPSIIFYSASEQCRHSVPVPVPVAKTNRTGADSSVVTRRSAKVISSGALIMDSAETASGRVEPSRTAPDWSERAVEDAP